MINTQEKFLFNLYKKSKVHLNYWLDRTIDLADLVLMNVYQLPWLPAQKIAQSMARFGGNLAWLLRDWPRLPAYKLTAINSEEDSARWTIIFAGSRRGLLEMEQLFSPKSKCLVQELDRVALWRLAGQAHQWLATGVDLIVYELSDLYHLRPEAPLVFTTSTWVSQSISIPASPDLLISGKKFATERHRLNKAKREGFDFKFSQSQADFDYFHYHMYLPYIKARHGHQAIVGRYEDQQQRWFKRGGLVLVTLQDRPVAGVLCYIANDTCYDIERGVLAADPELFKRGIDTIITWSAINWAYSQGAKTYNMGSSQARRSDGPFNSKRRWGAQLVKTKVRPNWTFVAKHLAPSLQEHLNKLGFISEINKEFYGVLLNKGTILTDQEVILAHEQGLAGVTLISPDTQPQLYYATH